MSKSSSGTPFKGKSGSTVTVLETHVLRNFARDAKVAFYTVGISVAVLASAILAKYTHPILAVVLGLLIGAPIGSLAWLIVKIWPVVRVLWWWSFEIVFTALFLLAWTWLASVMPLWLLLPVVAGLTAVVTLMPAVRIRVLSVFYCVAVRHRLRVCFSQFIIRSKTGSLPLILLARPTAVGERVWVFLRPGLSEADLNGQLDRLAVACWARAVTVTRPGNNAALVQIDIKRREVLTFTIPSPLPDLVDPETPVRPRPQRDVPTALNLADIPPSTPMGIHPKSAPASATYTPDTAKQPSGQPDDVNDWI